MNYQSKYIKYKFKYLNLIQNGDSCGRKTILKCILIHFNSRFFKHRDVEIGFLAMLLRLRGCIIIATDAFKEKVYLGDNNFIDIENIDAKSAVIKYNDFSVLLLCWPPHWNEMAYESIINFRGDTIIYIGEPENYAT